MSAQEERCRIIHHNIPNLIRSLTKFEPTDLNFQTCEQCAWYTIRNRRNLSVNSHEVRRRIDGVIEKFVVGNYPNHAAHFKRLCDELIEHPLCVNHYEIDVQWAVIDFLLNISYNPVGSIRRTQSNVELVSFKTQDKDIESDVDYWVQLLKEDCIPIDQQQLDPGDSDLSDWSECTSRTESSDKQTKSNVGETSPEKRLNKLCDAGLIAPQKEPHYKLFETSSSLQWLVENVQHTWWQESQSTTNVQTVNLEANFCRLWSQCVINTSKTYRKLSPVSTISEYCLLREIIWMFQAPASCKFFNVNDGKIILKNNVSIASVTENGLKSFLQYFVPSIQKLLELQTFIESIYNYQTQCRAPSTYECYASGLKELLKPLFAKLSATEERIKDQNIEDINTVLQMRYYFNKDLKYLDMLHSIHSFSILDHTKFPAHICSAHLLSGLTHKFNTSTCAKSANTAIALFLSSIKIFCQIIDTWWTEGRLDDWQNEFLVEKKPLTSDDIELRMYEKCRERSFFVPHTVSHVIQQDCLLALLKEHSMQAGCTLNLLYQINKINELKCSSSSSDTLYNSFIELLTREVWDFIRNESEFCSKTEIEKPMLSDDKCGSYVSCGKTIVNPDQFWAFQDEFLMMAFMGSEQVDREIESIENREIIPSIQLDVNVLEILNELSNSSETILPLENIIVNSFSALLKSRISFANGFVTNMYKNEFEIAKHLQYMRRVMLLEASEMHTFYIQVFKQIESGKTWANPFLLTVQLDDILCAKLPNMSSLFCVDFTSTFKSETSKVIDAVDALVITYDVNKQLRGIITEKTILQYNEVFRFLLKIKWGLWALENLQFQRKYRTQPPYAELKMIDLLMRRLEQLRFWILYAMQCIHFYLMAHVLQSMGMKLDEKIMGSTTLTDMRSIHESFIEMVCNHCFLKPHSSNIKVGIEQLLNLIYVLRYEWASCVAEIEDDDTEGASEEQPHEYLLSSQIDAIESTYIRCHGYLANILNTEVYAKQNSHLAGLSAAFNSSMPY